MHLKQEAFATSRRTCLDQGSVIVFADEYSPAEPDHISVPAFDMSNIMVRPLCLSLHPSSPSGNMACCCNAVLTEHTQAMPSSKSLYEIQQQTTCKLISNMMRCHTLRV